MAKYIQKLLLAITVCTVGIITFYFIFLSKNPVAGSHVATITRHLKLFTDVYHHNQNISQQSEASHNVDSFSVNVTSGLNVRNKISADNGDVNEIDKPSMEVLAQQSSLIQSQHNSDTEEHVLALKVEVKKSPTEGAVQDNALQAGAVQKTVVLTQSAVQSNVVPKDVVQSYNVPEGAVKNSVLSQAGIQSNSSPDGIVKDNPLQVNGPQVNVMSGAAVNPVPGQGVNNNVAPGAVVKNNPEVNVRPQPSCTPRLAVNLMKRIYSKFDENIPVFLSPGFENWNPRLMEYNPPFGLRNQVPLVMSLLSKVRDYRTPRELLGNKDCIRCIIIGNGSIIKGTRLGQVIDEYDVVFRLNSAPVAGYESDIGSKTTMRVAYPEGTSSYINESGSLYGLVSFKSQDFEWLDRVLTGQQPSMSGFWKSVPYSFSKKPSEVRLINPLLIRETSFDLIGFPVNGGVMKKNTPTTGVMLVSMAVRLCDEVHVAGFGYDFSRPDLPIHYYDDISMRVMLNHYTHDVPHEKAFLKRLVANGVIKDLTGGINW